MKRNLCLRAALAVIVIFLALSLFMPPRSSTAAGVAQKKFEYKVFTVSSSATASELERTLNEQGQMGWELVQVAFLPTGGFPPSTATTLIFKR